MNGAPEIIHNVSKSQLSVARLYGGAEFNGAEYRYDYIGDRLFRTDTTQAGGKHREEFQRMMATTRRILATATSDRTSADQLLKEAQEAYKGKIKNGGSSE